MSESYLDWFVVSGVTALRNSISVYIKPSPRERGKKNKYVRGERKMSQQAPPAPIASTVGLCLTIIQIGTMVRCSVSVVRP